MIQRTVAYECGSCGAGNEDVTGFPEQIRGADVTRLVIDFSSAHFNLVFSNSAMSSTLHHSLLYISKTIPRSSLKHQLKNSLNPSLHQKSLSTSPLIRLWGGDALARSLAASPSRSVLIGLQPVRPSFARAFTSTARRARDKDDDSADLPGGAGANQGDGSSSEGGGSGSGSGSGDNSSKSGSAFEAIQRTLASSDASLSKPSVPEVYPQVLALPITRRPLFPGFYKAVVIKNPHVTAAIKELLKRGQPYVGAFLLKDDEFDVDTITDIDQVYKVGVFAQITSVFPANGSGKDGEEAGLTAVLYPHRRIRIQELLPPKVPKDTAPDGLDVGAVEGKGVATEPAAMPPEVLTETILSTEGNVIEHEATEGKTEGKRRGLEKLG